MPASLTKWITGRTLFCVLTSLPLLLILWREGLRNDRLLHTHFAAPERMLILAVLLLLGALACACIAWKKHLPALPRGEQLWKAFGVACLYSLLGNAALYHSDALLLISAFSALGTLCLLWAAFKQLSLLFWIPFMVLEMVQMVAFHRYGSLINNDLVFAEILEASRDEIFSYATFPNACLMLLLLLFSCGLAWLTAKSLHGTHRLSLCVAGIASLLLAGVALTLSSPQKRHADNMWPLLEVRTLLNNYKSARNFNTEALDYIQSLPSPAARPSSISTLKPEQRCVLILHVGESIRADRLTLNGYLNRGRSTTPWLDSQKGQNLINFSNCISSSASTVFSHATILTDARRSLRRSESQSTPASTSCAGETITADADYLPRAGSVVDLFAANHFRVYSFLGRAIGQELQYDKIIRELTRPTLKRYYAVTHPQDVIPHMGQVLKSEPFSNLFFFIRNEGNHVPFCHYDEAKAPFLPTRPDFSNPAAYAEEVNNAYDNSTHYTDEYIRLVTECLQGRPYLYVYVSDHGEYLGHEGLWGRGGIGKRYHQTTACRVGMFIIASPEFRALHPHFDESLENLRTHADMTVGHEHIYHTLLGIFGISTPYYDSRLDLSAPAPEPYTGPQPTAAS